MKLCSATKALSISMPVSIGDSAGQLSFQILLTQNSIKFSVIFVGPKINLIGNSFYVKQSLHKGLTL